MSKSYARDSQVGEQPRGGLRHQTDGDLDSRECLSQRIQTGLHPSFGLTEMQGQSQQVPNLGTQVSSRRDTHCT